MSYSKPFLTTSDHAVGFQCVNRAIDNNRALFFDYVEPKHATGRDPADVFIGKGRHDDVLIARTVADFLFVTATLATGPEQLFAEVSGPMIVGAPVRMKTGQWKIYISTPQLFSAAATIKGATAGNSRQASCFVLVDSVGPYVIVSTWNVSGGVLADYDFSLVLWSRGVA